MINGVAFAGTTGSGKSTLLKLLSARLASLDRISLLLLRNDVIQNQIYNRFRAERSFAELSSFLSRPLELMAQFGNLVDRTPAKGRGPKLVVLFESWLLNLCAELGVDLTDELLALDERRAEFGLALVHLHFPPDLLMQRSVVLTRQHRGEGWRRYLDQLGADVNAQVLRFSRRRSRIEEMFASCRPPKIAIDTSDMDWQSYALQILDLMDIRDVSLREIGL